MKKIIGLLSFFILLLIFSCPADYGEMEIRPSELNLNIGDSYSFKAYSLGNTEIDISSDVIWASANEALLTINTHGIVEAIGSGEVIITATDNLTMKKATAKVIISEITDPLVTPTPTSTTVTPTPTPLTPTPPEPEITVIFNSTTITNGSNLDLGDQPIDPNAVINYRDFNLTIRNDGPGALILTGSPAVSLSGGDAADFFITQQPSGSIGYNESTSFTVRFAPPLKGLKIVHLTISNNDKDEGNFSFILIVKAFIWRIVELAPFLSGDFTWNPATIPGIYMGNLTTALTADITVIGAGGKNDDCIDDSVSPYDYYTVYGGDGQVATLSNIILDVTGSYTIHAGTSAEASSVEGYMEPPSTMYQVIAAAGGDASGYYYSEGGECNNGYSYPNSTAYGHGGSGSGAVLITWTGYVCD